MAGTQESLDVERCGAVGFKGQTSLKRVEVYRVRELILEDLKIHERSSRPEIHARIGAEIPEHKVRQALKALADEGVLLPEGQLRWRRYVLVKKGRNSEPDSWVYSNRTRKALVLNDFLLVARSGLGQLIQ